MYNRYGREGQGGYTRASLDDGPLPPPSGSGRQPPPHKPPPTPGAPQPPPPKPSRPPEIALGKGLLESLHLDDLDAGDLLLLFLLFFLFRQQADEELLIAIGLLLIL